MENLKKEVKMGETGRMVRTKRMARGNEMLIPRSVYYRLFQAAVAKEKYIRVDGTLYYRSGTFYEKLNANEILGHLLKILPQEMYDDIISANKTKLFELFSSIPDIPEYSREEVNEWYSDYIALKNCIVNIKTQKVYPATKNIICLVGLNAEYLEDTDLPTPVWDSFIEKISGGDGEIADRIKDVAANILMTGKNIKKFYVFGTAPSSGKSTLADFLESFFYKKDIGRMDMHDFKHKFSMGSLCNYAVNISMDLDSQLLSTRAVSNVKILTGERRIQKEAKYEQSQAVSCCCNLLFGTNFPIRLKKCDEAFFDRMEIVPFLNSVPLEERSRELPAKLLREKNAVVTKLIRRLKILAERNYELSRCSMADQMKKQWKAQQGDEVEGFLRFCCHITDKPDDYELTSKLHEKFRVFMGYQEGEGMNANVFSRKVREHICQDCNQMSNMVRLPGRETTARVIRGLQLKRQYEVWNIGREA